MFRKRSVNLVVMLFAGSWLLLAGCAGGDWGKSRSRYLVYMQNSVVGIDASATPQTGGKFTLGYDRQTDTIVPKRTDKKGETDGEDAMSVISKTQVKVGFLEMNEIHESFATGDAAVAIASDPNKVKSFSEAANAGVQSKASNAGGAK